MGVNICLTTKKYIGFTHLCELITVGENVSISSIYIIPKIQGRDLLMSRPIRKSFFSLGVDSTL